MIGLVTGHRYWRIAGDTPMLLRTSGLTATKRLRRSATAHGIGPGLGLFGGVWPVVVAEAKWLRHSATSTHRKQRGAQIP